MSLRDEDPVDLAMMGLFVLIGIFILLLIITKFTGIDKLYSDGERTGVVYKSIPRASVRLSMVRPSGPVRPVVEAFLATARKLPARQA